MARAYRHIQEYEKEILELKAQGATHREIAEHFGSTKEQVKGSFKRHHKYEDLLNRDFHADRPNRKWVRAVKMASCFHNKTSRSCFCVC